MGKRLLIIGAGGHGKVVKEIAVSLMENSSPVYTTVDFLDDNSEEAIGKVCALETIKDSYDEVFCGIGNNHVRKKLIEQAETKGCLVPALIHPTAYISPSAKIEKGTVIEPKAIVNANSTVKKGSIISVGAIIDHDVCVEEFVHVNAGAICKAGSVIHALEKLEAGQVVLGYGAIGNRI